MTLRAHFGDAEHVFALTAPMIAELEAVTGAGIGAIARRLENREFKLLDVQSVIRLALIGGGLDPETAARLVQNYIPARPLVEAHLLAVAVMQALWFGVEDADDNPVIAEESTGPDYSVLAGIVNARGV